MKKLVLMCLSLICAVAVYADGHQTCKLSGDDTVVVSTLDDDTKTTVTFSNDSNQYVNVSAKISFSKSGSREVSRMVPPHSESTLELSKKSGEWTTVSSVSGSKCK